MAFITLTYTTQADTELSFKYPSKFEVCDRCRGHGKYVNPNVDGNGISQEDFDNDPDFRDNYFSGAYDVTCYECKGERVTSIVDRARCSPRQLSRLVRIEDQQEYYDRLDWELAQESHMERMMGA